MVITLDCKIRFYLLMGDQLIADEIFNIGELKAKYPYEWRLTQGDLPHFVNLCLYKWGGILNNWNVGTFDIL